MQERAEADHGNIRRGLIAPEILEPICRQFSVAGGMLNVAVPQIMLDRPRVLPVVGQLVAGGVAQHVRMDRELDAGLASGSTDDLAHRIGAERRLALAHEYVGGVRVSPLQSAQDGLGSRTRRRGGLAQRRGGRWRLWCAGVGKKPDSVSEAACTGAIRPAWDLFDNATPHLRGLDRTQFWLGLPVG